MNFFTFISQEWLLVSVLLVLIYLYAWREKIKSGRPISVHEVTQLLNRDAAVLIDVRDAAEFKAGHIIGAIHIPFAKLESELDKLAAHKSKIIIVADKIGQHAGAAGRTLVKHEFVVRRLSGGISEWQAQNLPLVK